MTPATSDTSDDDLIGSKPGVPLPGDGGYFLHSWKIGFPHPTSDSYLQITCPPPTSFLKFVSPGIFEKLSTPESESDKEHG